MPRGTLAELLRILGRARAAPPGQELTDGVLLEQFLTQRDEGAFEQLMQRHGPMVLAVCQRVVGDAHAAEDAFQATFLVLARRAGTIRKSASVASWLHGVARRIAGRAKSQAAARQIRERRAADMPRAEPLDELTWQELRSVLDEELGRLPEKCRAAVVLCHLEGKSYEQAAVELGWPKSSLRNHLAKAKDLLRLRLARRGLALSAAALATVLTERAGAAPVSASLTLSILKAAGSVAAGKSVAAGCLSKQAIILAEEAMKWTIGTKGKLAILLLAMLLPVGAGLAGYGIWAEQAPPSTAPPVAQGDQPKRDAPPTVAQQRDGEALPDGALARLGADGIRHPGARQVIFSSDGKTLFSSGQDYVVRQWDVTSGKLVRAQRYTSDKMKYEDVVALGTYPHVSPDGKTVVVVGLKHVYFFDAATGKELHRIPQNLNRLEVQAISESGATFTADGKKFGVRIHGAFVLFDVATGKEKEIDTGLPKKLGMPAEVPFGTNVRAVLDPNGKQLATFSWPSPKDGVTLWDLSGGKILRTIRFPDPPVAHQDAPLMVYLATGDRLLLTSKKEAVLWNTATGEKVAAFPFSEGFIARNFAFSPDGSLLACYVNDGQTILLLDAKTMKEVRKLPSYSCTSFQFSPDGKTLAGFSTNVIHLWNVADGKPLLNSDDQDNVWWVVYSPDGRSLVSGGGDATIIWDLETKKPRATIRTPMWWLADYVKVPPSVFSADGKTLFGPVHFGTIKAWNVADGQEISTFLTADDEKGRDHQKFRWLGVSRDGKRLMAICSLVPDRSIRGENTLVVWDIAKGTRLDRTTFSEKYAPKNLSPNGSCITYIKDQNHVLYDLAEKQERVMGPISGRETLGSTSGFSHNEALLAISSSRKVGNTTESAVSVHETASGKLRITLLEPGVNILYPCAFTPDDRYLLCAGQDAWHVWEIATGKEVLRRSVENGRGGGVVAPDGRSAAMPAPDSTVLIWDLLPSSRYKGDLAAKDMEALWADLANEDAAKAYQAGGRLIGAPAAAWAFLDKQVRPVADETERIRHLIADLDSNDFDKRQAANKDLQQLELLAEPELRKTLDGKPSAETRKAVEALLDDVWTVKTAEERRRTRAVWVLEQIGTADARKTLERLAGGAAAARQTREAKAALLRLKIKE